MIRTINGQRMYVILDFCAYYIIIFIITVTIVM